MAMLDRAVYGVSVGGNASVNGIILVNSFNGAPKWGEIDIK
jgi:hypothetical protein